MHPEAILRDEDSHNQRFTVFIKVYFTNSKTFEAAPHPGSLKKDKKAKLIYELCWWVFIPLSQGSWPAAGTS